MFGDDPFVDKLLSQILKTYTSYVFYSKQSFWTNTYFPINLPFIPKHTWHQPSFNTMFLHTRRGCYIHVRKWLQLVIEMKFVNRFGWLHGHERRTQTRAREGYSLNEDYYICSAISTPFPSLWKICIVSTPIFYTPIPLDGDLWRSARSERAPRIALIWVDLGVPAIRLRPISAPMAP